MSRSRFGQTTPTTTTTVVRTPVYMPPMFMPYGAGGMPYPYYSPTGFQLQQQQKPGQPYKLDISTEEIEAAIYKDSPTQAKVPSVAEGTEPQKVVKLRSGLEVPSYIVQRDMKRREVAAKRAAAVREVKPPKYYKIGLFIDQNPMQASLIALLAGAVAGNLYFSSQSK